MITNSKCSGTEDEFTDKLKIQTRGDKQTCEIAKKNIIVDWIAYSDILHVLRYNITFNSIIYGAENGQIALRKNMRERWTRIADIIERIAELKW